jgi:hypothetical protein
MNASDITLLTFIVLIFVALYVVNVLAIGVENIKRNWPKYRCNPSIMPFAGTFGHDPVQNFTYCMQSIQTNYMGYLMQPFEYNLGVIGSLGSQLTGSIQKVRQFISYLRDMIISIVQNIFGVFLNLIIEIQRVLIGIKDLFSKLIGIFATLLFVLSGSIDTMKSAWNGPPGKLIRYVGKLA